MRAAKNSEKSGKVKDLPSPPQKSSPNTIGGGTKKTQVPAPHSYLITGASPEAGTLPPTTPPANQSPAAALATNTVTFVWPEKRKFQPLVSPAASLVKGKEKGDGLSGSIVEVSNITHDDNDDLYSLETHQFIPENDYSPVPDDLTLCQHELKRARIEILQKTDEIKRLKSAVRELLG